MAQSTVSDTTVAMGPVTTAGTGNKPFYLVEEEYTIGVPLVRPRSNFLQILRTTGATGETFTKKEICQYLKTYIAARHLYDVNNPRVVYCGRDPLGEVFQVDRFTIDNVLDLLTKVCTQVPDTCLKRKRRLVRKALPAKAVSLPQVSVEDISSTTPHHGFHKTVSSPLLSAPTPPPTHPIQTPTSIEREPTSLSLATAASSTGAEFLLPPAVVRTGAEQSVEDSVVAGRSGHTAGTVPWKSEKIFDRPLNRPLDRPSTSSASPTAVKSMSSEKVKSRAKRKRKRRKKEKSQSESSTGSSTLKQSSSSAGSAKRVCESRTRGTSLSINFSDTDSSAYPWYFRVKVQEEEREDQESEVWSVQDKETILVQDSTDDLWFLEDDESVLGGDSITMEFDSDAEFSFEYDVSSDSLQMSESDINSDTSEEGVLVVCKDSDVEFFADSESDSDSSEISKEDRWSCRECSDLNPPFQRFCNRCWKLRSDWLPDKLRDPGTQPKKWSHTTSLQEQEGQKEGTLTSSQTSQEEAALHRKLIDEGLAISGLEAQDSGIGSTQPSSQESGGKTIDTNGVDRYPSLLSTLQEDTKDMEVRYTFSNFRMKDDSAENTSLSVTETATSGPLDSSVKDKGSNSSSSEACVICLTRPKTASIIHGKSGHQVCCYSCARRLKRRGKPCPVCRRPIQKVVKNYIL